MTLKHFTLSKIMPDDFSHQWGMEKGERVKVNDGSVVQCCLTSVLLSTVIFLTTVVKMLWTDCGLFPK